MSFRQGLIECSPIGFSSRTSAQWLTDHEEPTRRDSPHRQNAPCQRIRTANGYLMIAAAGGPILLRCAEALGHKEWCDAGRFVTNRQRLQNREALEAQWRRC